MRSMVEGTQPYARPLNLSARPQLPSVSRRLRAVSHLPVPGRQ